jgi:hypothetical protein
MPLKKAECQKVCIGVMWGLSNDERLTKRVFLQENSLEPISKLVMPTKVGIQRLQRFNISKLQLFDFKYRSCKVTGFRVKPGMTKKD